MQLLLGDSEKLALSRLARRRGFSQAQVVSRLVQRPGEEVVEGLDPAAFETHLR